MTGRGDGMEDRDGDWDVDEDGEPAEKARTDPDAPLSRPLGSRVERKRLYYRDLADFVERLVARVWPIKQGTPARFAWIPDWWRYPALVFPLDALWRAYELTRRSAGQMMVWWMQATSLLTTLYDPDRGVAASLDPPRLHTRCGEPLPCTPPPADWRERIAEQLAPPPHGTDGSMTRGKETEDAG